jgi:hypothetical protein
MGASAAAGWRQAGRAEASMRDIDLFQAALGLVPPWMVVAAKLRRRQEAA